MKRLVWWILLTVFVGCVLALNYWCLPAHDELGYTFQGECTPMMGVAHHVASLKDIVDIQIADYQHGPNGRVFLHSLVVLFSGWELYTLFDFLNTGMWFLLVWLVLREGGVKVDSVRKYVLGCGLSFLFLWYAEMCCYNAAFAVNYLWTAVITIGFVNLWRRFDAWWLCPVCFLYGWWMEVFSMPMIAALGSVGLISWWRNRRFPWSVRRCMAMGLMILGAFGCCGSHLVSGRAAESGEHGLGALIVAMVKSYASLALGLWPLALVVCVLLVVWICRRRLQALYDSAPEWWLYFVFGAGVYLLLGKEGMRMAYPMFLAGTILVFQNRSCFGRVRKLAVPILVFVTLWMGAGAVLQYRIGTALNEMEETYAKDPQGIAFRRAHVVGPWQATVSLHRFNKWHRSLFKHKFRHDKLPAVLSPYLYQSLYLQSTEFFAEAENLTGRVFAPKGERNYVVQKGSGPLTSEEATAVRDYLFSADKKTGLRKYLPGRFADIFPSSDYYFALPRTPFEFVAKDGCVYTLHSNKVN